MLRRISTHRYAFIAILLLICLAVASAGPVAAKKSKRKWVVVKKLGKVSVSHYTPQSNTPPGSRQTSSGKKAKPNHTIAVDRHHKAAPMFAHVRLKYKSANKHRKKTVIYTVEDTGAFKRYGRDFDVFTLHSGQGVVNAQAEIVRKETQAEYEKRIALQKMKHVRWLLKQEFTLEYDSSLGLHQLVTDPKYIKGGCICFGGSWFDVVKTKKGLKNKILVGTPIVKELPIKIKLQLVEEDAVG